MNCKNLSSLGNPSIHLFFIARNRGTSNSNVTLFTLSASYYFTVYLKHSTFLLILRRFSPHIDVSHDCSKYYYQNVHNFPHILTDQSKSSVHPSKSAVEAVDSYVYLGVSFTSTTWCQRLPHSRLCSSRHAMMTMPPSTLPGT